MSQKLNKVIAEAMELSFKERAQLAGELLLSLDEPSESEVEKLWIEESKHRLQKYRDGETKGIPANKVFKNAINDIS